MNPFDLRGPEFLVFYLIVSAVVILAVRYRRIQRETAPTGSNAKLTNPYQVAYLRSGINEAARVAEYRLIDRGYLKVEGPEVVASGKPEAMFATDPLERAILEHYEKARTPDLIFTSHRLHSVSDSYQRELEEKGLMPAPSLLEQRNVDFMIGALAIAGVAVLKMVIAVTGGHRNIGFLLICAIAGCLALAFINRARRTPNGDSFLMGMSDLVNYYSRDRDDIVWSAAVHGVKAIPDDLFPEKQNVFGKASSAQADSGSSGCGSSCGSSSSSSSSGGDSGGGSSCGGCGGGCGGCGS